MSTSSDDGADLRASDADRDAVLAVLGEALSLGRLSIEEYEERQNQALAARTMGELVPLTRDLPEARDLPAPQGHPGRSLTASTGSGAVVPARPGDSAVETSVAIMGGKELVVAPGTPTIRSIAVMGGDTIDLTGVLGPGVEITVQCWSMWGGNDIHLPPGVRVIDRTVNIMAGNDIAADARGDGSNGTVILAGVSLMAGHDIQLAPDHRPRKSRRKRRD